jgi:hypothetical protein
MFDFDWSICILFFHVPFSLMFVSCWCWCTLFDVVSIVCVCSDPAEMEEMKKMSSKMSLTGIMKNMEAKVQQAQQTNIKN